MEIFSRIAARSIIAIHIGAIALLLLVNIGMFIWSVLLNLHIRQVVSEAFTD